jgi:hypothetical protein
MRNYDSEATGRLVITVDGGHAREGRPSSFADRKSWSLEDKLPELLRELEIRAAEDEHRKRELELQAQERQRQWELAMDRAKDRFLEAHRVNALGAEISAWREASTVRAYLTALEAEHRGTPAADEWISWIRGYLRRLDPLGSIPVLPTMPEKISLEELRPFMDGLSPYGPSSM